MSDAESVYHELKQLKAGILKDITFFKGKLNILRTFCGEQRKCSDCIFFADERCKLEKLKEGLL